MKLSTACVVLAAFAAAAPPALANTLVSTTVPFTGVVFTRLIKTQVLVKTVEKRNDDFLLPALNDLSRELHQGLDSDIFRINSSINKTLIDTDLKIGQISRNVYSILSQIESVAHTITTLHSSNATFDFNILGNHIKTLSQDTFDMTNDVLRFIEETMEMLGKGVSGPLKMLQLTLQLTSDDKLIRERANIRLQQGIINNPPKNWFFTDYDAVRAAKTLKRKSESTVNRIENLVTLILEHAKWLEGMCLTIRKELDNEHIYINAIHTKIMNAREDINAITELDSQNMSDEYLREVWRNLVHVMNHLRDEVFNITRNRTRRAAGTYNDAASEPSDIATEHSSLAIFLDQPRPSWLDKTPYNGCFYIYNNRTTGCIFVKTFNFMKAQYTWLSNQFKDFKALFQIYEKQLEQLTTQVLNVSKNTSSQFEAAKLIADLETSKVFWSDDIKKIRDLFENLNAYAESLFSDANAQLKIKQSNDDTLNAGIMRAISDNTKTSMDILVENKNDISVIDNKVVVMVCRFYNVDSCLNSDA